MAGQSYYQRRVTAGLVIASRRTMSRSKQELVELAVLSKAELSALFESHYRRPPPSRMRREMLALAVAYRIQENGRADRKLQRRLAKLVTELRQTGRVTSGKQITVKPGMRLVREWQGESHHVKALDKGFLYRGQCYGSLSEIARTITGTQWSGPVFFGLKGRSAR